MSRRSLMTGCLVLVKCAVSLALIAFLASRVDLGIVHQRLLDLRPEFLLAAAAALMVLMLPGALRWSLVLRTLGRDLSWRHLLPIFWAGMFFNQALPSTIGGDAIRIWQLHRHGLPAWQAANSVVLDRVCGLLALLALILASSPLVLTALPDPRAPWAIPLLVAASAGGIAFLAVLDQLPTWLCRWRMFSGLAQFSRDLRRTVAGSREAPAILLLGILGYTVVVGAVHMLTRGMGIPVSFFDCMVVIPVVLLISTIPISLAGWGVREGAMVVGFARFGVDVTDAVTVSVLFGLLLIVASLPGGLMWVVSLRRSATPPED